MALQACRECGREISRKAEACPNCGAPGPKARRPKFGFLSKLVLLLAGLAAVWFFVLPPQCKSAFRKFAPAVTPDPIVRFNDTIQINEDQYWHLSFRSTGGTARATIRVAAGPAVDVYVMNARGFEEWKRATRRLTGGQYHFIPAMTQENARSVSRSAHLPAGQYVLVVDNTDYGGASPPMNMVNDRATVEVKLALD